MSETRWQTRTGLSDLTEAVDEIYALRAMLADEADIIAAHLDYKTFPKTRREVAERQIERMRQAARGEYRAAQRLHWFPKVALSNAGADDCLTNHQWAEQRGLIPATTHRPETTTDAREANPHG